MRKVIAYIDGFNLYHAIDDLEKPHLKWLDLKALAATICGEKETLVATKYFSAHATWLEAPFKRHLAYVAALKHVGVDCYIGHFKEKHRHCAKCGATWIGHEEKETDVAIAVELVADAFLNRFDRALIISADSDLGPAIKSVKANFPKKAVNVIAPPGRKSHARDLSPLFEITSGRLARCLLPPSANDASGALIFKRPPSYDPPKNRDQAKTDEA
jgi:NYN domain